MTQAAPKCDNIVEVFDTDIITVTGDQYVCLQLEFVEGENLFDRLHRQAIGQQDAIRVAIGIVTGLSKLHNNRLLHRDLKLANVLLSDLIPKIADFGSVANLSDDAQFVRASRHSALYVPPEGWEEPSRFTFASDIYQAGMILYELVNGPLEDKEAHYLTRKGHRCLVETGKTLQTLGDYERNVIINDCIAELAKKRGLLAWGRKARPYYSAKIRRLVGRATNPKLEDRLPSAIYFLGQLTQIDVPNWHPESIRGYRANGWHGWDWQVLENTDGTCIVKKSRQSMNSFRRCERCPSLERGFTFVENQ